MFKRFNITNTPFKSLNDGSSDFWTLSSQGTNEYYYNQTDVKFEPLKVLENNSDMNEGVIGSLSVGEWAWGDNDSLGYNTIYVRLSDNTDPDTKTSGYLKCTPAYLLLQKQQNSIECIVTTLEFSNQHKSFSSYVKEIRTDKNDNIFFTKIYSLPNYEYYTQKHPTAYQDQDKVYIMADIEFICVHASAEES